MNANTNPNFLTMSKSGWCTSRCRQHSLSYDTNCAGCLLPLHCICAAVVIQGKGLCYDCKNIRGYHFDSNLNISQSSNTICTQSIQPSTPSVTQLPNISIRTPPAPKTPLTPQDTIDPHPMQNPHAQPITPQTPCVAHSPIMSPVTPLTNQDNIIPHPLQVPVLTNVTNNSQEQSPINPPIQQKKTSTSQSPLILPSIPPFRHATFTPEETLTPPLLQYHQQTQTPKKQRVSNHSHQNHHSAITPTMNFAKHTALEINDNNMSSINIMFNPSPFSNYCNTCKILVGNSAFGIDWHLKNKYKIKLKHNQLLIVFKHVEDLITKALSSPFFHQYKSKSSKGFYCIVVLAFMTKKWQRNI